MNCCWCGKRTDDLKNEVVTEKPKQHFCNLPHARYYFGLESPKQSNKQNKLKEVQEK